MANFEFLEHPRLKQIMDAAAEMRLEERWAGDMSIAHNDVGYLIRVVQGLVLDEFQRLEENKVPTLKLYLAARDAGLIVQVEPPPNLQSLI